MDRAKVIKGLEMIINGQRAPATWDDVLRAAIALLTPPTTEEIEAARKMVGREWSHSKGIHDLLDRALDALAREPGLEKSVEEGTVWIGKLLAERDALEAKLARVREAARSYIKMLDEQDDPSVGFFHREEPEERSLRAALADEATP